MNSGAMGNLGNTASKNQPYRYSPDVLICSENRQFYLFVEDTNLLYSDKNFKSLENLVEAGLMYRFSQA